MLKIGFAVCLLLLVCNQVNAEYSICKPGDLVVTQTALPLPRKVHIGQKNKYEVVVENRCVCSQQYIELACPGFSSAMGVDPKLLRPAGAGGDGKLCILNDNFPISQGPEHAVKFTYVSSSKISFKFASSILACS